MSKFSPTEYKLQCVATAEEFDDAGWTLDSPTCEKPSLIRALYAKKQLTVYDDKE